MGGPSKPWQGEEIATGARRGGVSGTAVDGNAPLREIATDLGLAVRRLRSEPHAACGERTAPISRPPYARSADDRSSTPTRRERNRPSVAHRPA